MRSGIKSAKTRSSRNVSRMRAKSKDYLECASGNEGKEKTKDRVRKRDRHGREKYEEGEEEKKDKRRGKSR